MNLPFVKKQLGLMQIEAALQYVKDKFGEVPLAPDAEMDDLASQLEDMMNQSDFAAWAGHLITTPLGVWAIARLKLGFGAPTQGLQWLGMKAFVTSCRVLIMRGFPPAGVKLPKEPKRRQLTTYDLMALSLLVFVALAMITAFPDLKDWVLAKEREAAAREGRKSRGGAQPAEAQPN